MAKTKSKTFADRMRAEAREIDGQSWQFGISMVKAELEEQLVEGLKAFAKLWFLELTDETELPSEFYRLKDAIERNWLIFDQDSELEDDEDEDEEEGA